MGEVASMNPLTQIKNTQKATKAEIDLGLTDKASWHDRFKHSAYVFAGGLPFELTEGDLLAVFAQYGEVVDVHLVRDRKTGAWGRPAAWPPGWTPACAQRCPDAPCWGWSGAEGRRCRDGSAGSAR